MQQEEPYREIEIFGVDLKAIVSESDFLEINSFSWYLDHKGYVITKVFNSTISMHLAVMGVNKHKHIDHINRDKLDNRRSNLRVCTQKENMRNRRKWTTAKTTSQYKGVSWVKRAEKFCAAIGHYGKSYIIGYYDSELDAAMAYNSWANYLHGEFACLNEISPKFADIDVEKLYELRNSGIRSDNTSNFRGVNYDKIKKKWRSYFSSGGKQVFVGYFNCPEEAYHAKLRRMAECDNDKQEAGLNVKEET